jgi:hypothetical protein
MPSTSPPSLLASALALAACAEAAPLAPPPASALPPPRPVVAAAPPSARPAPVPPPVAAPAPPPEPPLEVWVVMETPYKMDARVDPATEAEWLAEFRERRVWSHGGMGELVGEPRPVQGHPDPRVIVNIDKVEGPHDADKLQRIARQYHWINVVRCYGIGWYKKPDLEGWTHAEATISSGGAVLRPKLVDTELDDGDVAKCVVDKLRSLKMPRAARSSRAFIDIRVGPGDEPVPPPDDLIVPGDGELPVDEMKRGVEPALPLFEQCYRAAFDYAPALWGRIEIRFHLTDKGKLDEAFEAKDTQFPDARVRQCVLAEARKLKFTKPKGGDLRFVVPIRFSNSRSLIPSAQPVQPANAGQEGSPG